MTKHIVMIYPCPKCGVGQALMPQKIEANCVVHCAQCGRKHGYLADIQKELAHKAREEGIQRAERIYRSCSSGKYGRLR